MIRSLVRFWQRAARYSFCCSSVRFCGWRIWRTGDTSASQTTTTNTTQREFTVYNMYVGKLGLLLLKVLQRKTILLQNGRVLRRCWVRANRLHPGFFICARCAVHQLLNGITMRWRCVCKSSKCPKYLIFCSANTLRIVYIGVNQRFLRKMKPKPFSLSR
jgi:hypothetical protein